MTGKKLRKRKVKNETAICRGNHFRGVLQLHEQLLMRLHLKSRQKVLASALAVVFVPMSTLTSNAVQAKHIHREEKS